MHLPVPVNSTLNYANTSVSIRAITPWLLLYVLIVRQWTGAMNRVGAEQGKL